ncbi:hypothetical protein ACJX0J_027380, partial [Zea mays]
FILFVGGYLIFALSLLVVVELSRLETLMSDFDLIAMGLSTMQFSFVVVFEPIVAHFENQIARLGRKYYYYYILKQQANNPITFLQHRTGSYIVDEGVPLMHESLDLDDKIWLDSFLNLQNITCYFHFMLKCHEQL